MSARRRYFHISLRDTSIQIDYLSFVCRCVQFEHNVLSFEFLKYCFGFGGHRLYFIYTKSKVWQSEKVLISFFVFRAFSLSLLWLPTSSWSCREERRDNGWRNNDFDSVQVQRLRPKSATRRTVESQDDSSEEEATNSPSLGK